MAAETPSHRRALLAIAVLLAANAGLAHQSRRALAQLELTTAWPVKTGDEGKHRIPVQGLTTRQKRPAVVEVEETRLRVTEVAVHSRGERWALVQGLDGSLPILVEPPLDIRDQDPVRIHP